ncbi:glycosyltransferase family 1 protein [Sphingomonas sp. LY29]|uniref:glycosyltransferase family 4 protein n=1 Tax=Sphingomonas sp. LY29 TaxID=3095341 RepID=UPI002D767F6E|nr:glycosyltransferase family 1 protein [Sphingomonas sp. LY29]WRP26340.1 glycosyltransferase family 1 protein [Sphingomonas sp. LY29]
MPSQFGGLPSGVARVAFALLQRLVERGDHEYVLRSNWSRADIPAPLVGLKLLEVPRPRVMIVNVLRQWWTMPALCRRHGIDIIWNIDAFGAARGGRARVTTIHDLYFETIPGLLGRRAVLTMATCTRLVVGGSQRVVAISRMTKGDLARLYPWAASRTVMIPNDTTLVSAGPGHDEIGRPYVLLVGNGTPNKNFGIVVAALDRLANRGDRPVLVHVGKDEDGMLDAALRAAVHPPKVISLAGVEECRLSDLYAHARCLVVPSVSEGFCLPILEAQSLGCPVIVSSSSVMPEVAGDGALFFVPDDSEMLAARLTELFDTPSLRADLILRGKANRARYSWDKSAASYAELFTALLEEC